MHILKQISLAVLAATMPLAASAPASAKPHQAKVADIDFTLHRGEVLGFFGLIGAGPTEIMEMVFGVRLSTGTISIDGKPVTIREPADAIAHGVGS